MNESTTRSDMEKVIEKMAELGDKEDESQNVNGIPYLGNKGRKGERRKLTETERRSRSDEARAEKKRLATLPRNEIERSGFFWDYLGTRFFNRQYGEDGFTEGEVRKIGGQVKRKLECRMLSEINHERYIRITDIGVPFYIRVNEYGEVFWPEGTGSGESYQNKVYVRTSDSKQIRGYANRARKVPEKNKK